MGVKVVPDVSWEKQPAKQRWERGRGDKAGVVMDVLRRSTCPAFTCPHTALSPADIRPKTFVFTGLHYVL